MSQRHKALKLVNVFIWGLTLFLLINLLAYALPLDVSNLQTYTDKEAYTTGETIVTVNLFESFETASSTYDNRVVCRNGTERRAFLGTVVANTTPRPQAQSFAEFTVPPNITGHNCVLQNTATSCVQRIPLVTKCVTEITESNKFTINERE